MTIDEIISNAFNEDLGDGDHTTLATIPANIKGKARLVIKEKGIIAGVKIAEKVFKQADKKIQFRELINDGNEVKEGDIVFTVSGFVRSILISERLALNFMQRMSGIATHTNAACKKLKGLKTKILDTRKTTPNFRLFEKMAVRTGGGENHRMGLYDMIMIKDNHVDFAGGITQAIKSVNTYLQENNKKLKIEIEVRNFKELEQVLSYGNVDMIMLDNFSSGDLEKAVKMVNGKYETEASGNINLDNIREYALSGVDYISMGALTHQIKSLDMSLKSFK